MTRDLQEVRWRTYFDVPIDIPTTGNVTIDAINLKGSTLVLIDLGFCSRSAHVNAERPRRQILVKVALSGI